VHVLEMLAEEHRDYGLAEIIDRIHAAGIKAHDDAVRSITIKLMKDGSVERVGRGQYRLVRRAAPEQSTSTGPAPTGPAPAEQPAPESYPPALNLGQPW
jgi:predicted transcriptional regulator of viral defense system